MRRNVRKPMAAELLRMLETGPAFSAPLLVGDKAFTPEYARESYQLWVRSWILPKVKHLVPELKPKPTTEATP